MPVGRMVSRLYNNIMPMANAVGRSYGTARAMLYSPIPIGRMVCQLYNNMMPMPNAVGQAYGVPTVE